MKQSKLFIIFVFVITLFLFIGCAETGRPEQLPEETEVEEDIIDGRKYLDDQSAGVFEGDKIKSFYLEDNSCNSVRSVDLKGKVSLLNFWTSWSLESEAVNDILTDYNKRFEDVMNIVSVNVTAVEGHNLEYVIKYIRNKGYDFPIYFDLEGIVAKQYLIRSFPTTYLVDKEGVVAKIYVGEINEKDLMKDIKELTDEQK